MAFNVFEMKLIAVHYFREGDLPKNSGHFLKIRHAISKEYLHLLHKKWFTSLNHRYGFFETSTKNFCRYLLRIYRNYSLELLIFTLDGNEGI